MEMDVHVLRGRVEVRHAKVARPTRRLWEPWYLLPAGVVAVAASDVLAAVGPATPVLLDLKCFTRGAARRIASVIPADQPVIVSSRSWWVLQPFAERPGARRLRSCGSRLQLWAVLAFPWRGHEVGVTTHERFLTPAVLRRLRRKFPAVFSWGVVTRERCRELVAEGVMGLVLDDPSIGEGLRPVR